MKKGRRKGGKEGRKEGGKERREGRKEAGREGESNKVTERMRGANPGENLLCHNCAFKQLIKKKTRSCYNIDLAIFRKWNQISKPLLVAK